MTTNGTLFDPDAKAWFSHHRDTICCGASYDGTAAVQVANRGTPSNGVDLRFFADTWPGQGVHMTVSKQGLAYLADGILAVQRDGVRIEAALAEGIDWTSADAEMYGLQLAGLAEAYLADPSLPPVNLLTRLVSVAQPVSQRRQAKFCGAGTHMVTYDVDGRSFGCHMFSPLVLGKNAVERDKIDWECPDMVGDPACAGCILAAYCPTCAGFNLRDRGNAAIRDKRKCRMVLREAAAAADFQLRLIAQRRNRLDEIDAQHVDAALKAFDTLRLAVGSGWAAPDEP
jgi:hypothetical protein